MKKNQFVYSFLCSLFLAFFLSVPAFAAEGKIYFSDPDAEEGNNVEVLMTVQCESEKIGEVNILLKYPGEDLVFVEGTSASGGAGTIRVHGNGENTENGKYVFGLTFAAKNQGDYSVTIDSEEVYTESGAAVTITHKGSSTIHVTSSATLNKDLLLSSLEVSPGTLIPVFDPSVANYNITVGLSVDRLTINANPADSGSKVSVENNESLAEGENDVVIYVRSEDGSKQSEYHITVLKTEGGEENVPSESESAQDSEVSTGVKLSCKGKSIKIMEPAEDIAVPEGYRESTIKIDDQPVTGWIPDDTDNPEYFLVYGMNDDGETGFYRYDRKEKTIQRYFNDNETVDVRTAEEYLALSSQLEESQKELETQKMFLYIIGIILLVLAGILIYLAIRLGTVNRELQLARDRAGRREQEKNLDPERSRRSRHVTRATSDEDATVLIRHDGTGELPDGKQIKTDPDGKRSTGGEELNTDKNEDKLYAAVNEDELNGMDETKVLNSRGRRRISRRAGSVSDETTVIRRESRRRRDNQ